MHSRVSDNLHPMQDTDSAVLLRIVKGGKCDMKKRVHKGFTLLELIIVMALFSLVMYSVVQLMAPVSKFFVRSSNYESSTACADNMKRAIEGNLKYADRVRCYSDYAPCVSTPHSADPNDYVASAAMIEQVNVFWTDFFMNRQYIDYKGKIYVLAFDNTVYESNLGAYGTLSSFTDAQLNSGQIIMFEFNFGKTEGLVTNAATAGGKNYYTYFSSASKGTADGQYTVRPWYVNQKMYGNYEYQFSLGDGSFTLESGALFDPTNCTINIEAYELQRNGGNGLILNKAPHRSTASFAMKNVLDATTKYTQPLFDHKTLKNSTSGVPAYEKVITDPTPVSRYSMVEKNPSAGFSAASLSDDGTTRPGFYFIFTVPEAVDSVSAGEDAEFDAYIAAVDAQFPKG